MRDIREVTVFSPGDSLKLSTWSNVPYFFTKTLESKGIIVNRVDINPISFIERLYDLLVWRVLHKFKKGYFTKYLHTYINHWEVQRRIRKAVRRYPNSDANVFFTFSHTSKGWGRAPVVLFCDWTIDYYFKYFENRKPMAIERWSLQRQDRKIEEADLVISLFPGVTDYMHGYYRNKHIVYLGNVVNSELSVAPREVIAKKVVSKDLLFIGNRKYVEGANCLIRAFRTFKNKYPEARCHIIGMEAKHLEQAPEGVVCYGYLDKAKDEDRALYYSLLQQVKVIVNTTAKWGAFSSTIEAMYFYNPVITSDYKEFVQTFGEEIAFGEYCESESPEALLASLERLFGASESAYESMCLAAHEAVKPFTWDVYVDRVLEKIRDTNLAL